MFIHERRVVSQYLCFIFSYQHHHHRQIFYVMLETMLLSLLFPLLKDPFLSLSFQNRKGTFPLQRSPLQLQSTTPWFQKRYKANGFLSGIFSRCTDCHSIPISITIHHFHSLFCKFSVMLPATPLLCSFHFSKYLREGCLVHTLYLL